MMVHRHKCPGCGNEVDYLKRDGSLVCGDCDGAMAFEGTAGCVSGAVRSDGRSDRVGDM